MSVKRDPDVWSRVTVILRGMPLSQRGWISTFEEGRQFDLLTLSGEERVGGCSRHDHVASS